MIVGKVNITIFSREKNKQTYTFWIEQERDVSEDWIYIRNVELVEAVRRHVWFSAVGYLQIHCHRLLQMKNRDVREQEVHFLLLCKKMILLEAYHFRPRILLTCINRNFSLSWIATIIHQQDDKSAFRDNFHLFSLIFGLFTVVVCFLTGAGPGFEWEGKPNARLYNDVESNSHQTVCNSSIKH